MIRIVADANFILLYPARADLAARRVHRYPADAGIGPGAKNILGRDAVHRRIRETFVGNKN